MDRDYFKFTPSQQHVLKLGRLSREELDRIKQCRGSHNRLGFCYQWIFVKVMHYLPAQKPFEIIEAILLFASAQIRIEVHHVENYQKRRETIAEHQEQIRMALNLKRFNDESVERLSQFLLLEAFRLEQFDLLFSRAQQFLREQKILYPAQSTLERLIVTQQEKSRQLIEEKANNLLTESMKNKLDQLLIVEDEKTSLLQQLKQPPGFPSSDSIISLTKKLETIKKTQVLDIDLTWLNNNYQRLLTKYAYRYSIYRLRRLSDNRRCTVLICFLKQCYQDTIDYIIDMFFKLLNRIYNHANHQIDEASRLNRKKMRTYLITLKNIGNIVLNREIKDDEVRNIILNTVSEEELRRQIEGSDDWLSGKYSHVFKLIIQRFSYLRQFSPEILKHLEFKLEEGVKSDIMSAVDLLRELNENNKRKLPDEVPIQFIPKSIRPFVYSSQGQIKKSAWECALLVNVRDQIKSGNIFIKGSKRFEKLDEFFMPDEQWELKRDEFFKRAGLPVSSQDVPAYLTKRLNRAIDEFLEKEPQNFYAKIENNQWVLSVDSAEELSSEEKMQLEALKKWLSQRMREIKLPVEV